MRTSEVQNNNSQVHFGKIKVTNAFVKTYGKQLVQELQGVDEFKKLSVKLDATCDTIFIKGKKGSFFSGKKIDEMFYNQPVNRDTLSAKIKELFLS